jgi:hypothetical protein
MGISSNFGWSAMARGILFEILLSRQNRSTSFPGLASDVRKAFALPVSEEWGN